MGSVVVQPGSRVPVGLVVLVLLLGMSCAGGSSGLRSSSAGPTPGSTAEAELTVGDERPVTVHLPLDRDPSGAPLLLALHGYSSSPSELESYFGLDRVARERGLVYVYPEGTMDDRGNRFWNATDACCDFGRTGVADDAYLARLIDEIAARVAIDPRRVFVVGHSNGGFMSHRMACRHADVVAAIVSLAGVTFADPADCAPSEPVAVLQVHGTADDTIRFEGGSIAAGVPGEPPRYPGAVETVAAWAAADGCDAEVVDTGTRIDIDPMLEGPVGPAETTVAKSTGCDDGGFVELWTIEGGGHVPDLSPGFPEALVEFLLAHPKPPA